MGQAVNDILFTFRHSISFPIQINNSNIYKNEWMNDIVVLCCVDTVVVQRFVFVVIKSFFFVFRYGSRWESGFDHPSTLL